MEGEGKASAGLRKLLLEDPEIRKAEQRALEKLNEDVDTIRRKALPHARVHISSSKSALPVSIPPVVRPRESGILYDYPRCLEFLKKPVVVKDWSSAGELEKVLYLVTQAEKVGLMDVEVPGGMQAFVSKLMALIKRMHSEKAMCTAMVRSGYLGFKSGEQLRNESIPEDLGLQYFKAAVDILREDPLEIEAFIVLSNFLNYGGPAYYRAFHKSGILEPLMTAFNGLDLTLDDLLRPWDCNLAQWMIKLFNDLLSSEYYKPPSRGGPGEDEVEAALIAGGAARKMVCVLAHMTARADGVPPNARLIAFGKMLQGLSLTLGNISNCQDAFLADIRTIPEFPATLTWLILDWDYDPASGTFAVILYGRLLRSSCPEDNAIAAEIARAEGLALAVARLVDFAPKISAMAPEFVGFSPQELEILPNCFLDLVFLEAPPPGSSESLSPGHFPTAVVATIARLAFTDDVPAVRARANDTLQRLFNAAGRIETEEEFRQLVDDVMLDGGSPEPKGHGGGKGAIAGKALASAKASASKKQRQKAKRNGW